MKKTERMTKMDNRLTVGNMISYHRRLNFMTQEELALRLNVSSQAVSKWEQQLSSPDISLLPVIADVFNISIDTLFGRTTVTEPVFELVDSVPWEDDGKIRFEVFHGKKLMHHSEKELYDGKNTVSISFDYGSYKINGVCKLNKG